MAHVKRNQEVWGFGVMNILVVDSDRADRKKLVKMLKKLKKGSGIFAAEDDDVSNADRKGGIRCDLICECLCA